jgi:large subunit ribosomal protein L17
MKHLHKGRIFGRERDQRRALLRNLANSFFMHLRIETTVAKAKEVQSFVERLITSAKIDTLAKRRQIAETLSPESLKKATAVAKDFADRKGGYTRVIKIGRRKNDSSEMAILELVK